MTQSNDLQSEAEFLRKVAAIKSSFGLVLNRCEHHLSMKDSKPQVFQLERYSNMCRHRVALLQKKKEDGFFGAFSERPELSEIEKSLEETISKLQDAKKELEDKGHQNIADVIINDYLPELLQRSDVSADSPAMLQLARSVRQILESTEESLTRLNGLQ